MVLVKVLSPAVATRVTPVAEWVTSTVGTAAHILAASSAGTPQIFLPDLPPDKHNQSPWTANSSFPKTRTTLLSYRPSVSPLSSLPRCAPPSPPWMSPTPPPVSPWWPPPETRLSPTPSPSARTLPPKSPVSSTPSTSTRPPPDTPALLPSFMEPAYPVAVLLTLMVYWRPAISDGESWPKVMVLVKVLSPAVATRVTPVAEWVTSTVGLAAHILAASSAGTPTVARKAS